MATWREAERERERAEHTCRRGAAKVDADRGPHAALEAVEVGPVEDAVAHGGEEAAEVGAAKVGAGPELGQGVRAVVSLRV